MTLFARRAGAVLLSAALAAIGAAPAVAQDEAAYDAATVVATVGDVDVTLGDLIRARQGLDPQLQSLPPEVLLQGLIDQYVAELLFSQAAERAGLAERPDVAADIADSRRQILALAYRDAKLRELYEAAVADGRVGAQVELSQILLATEDEALAVKAELEAGADFATLAQERSNGPAAASGGALGSFSEAQLPVEFAAAIRDLEPGGISDPVQTTFGFHVFRLDGRAAGAPIPFEVWIQTLDQETLAEATEAAVEAAKEEIPVELPTDLPPASAILEDALIAN